MDRDVLGLQVHDLAKGLGKALGGVPGQSGDEVHVDGEGARLPDLAVGPKDVGCGMGPAHAAEDLVIHGLGVDRDPVHPVSGQDGQLFRVDGVGPAGLHGELGEPVQGELPLQGGEDSVQLLG